MFGRKKVNPFPVVEVKGVDVVEVLAVAEVVVEAPEHDEVSLHEDHPVPRARRGAAAGTAQKGRNFFCKAEILFL